MIILDTLVYINKRNKKNANGYGKVSLCYSVWDWGFHLTITKDAAAQGSLAPVMHWAS